MLDAIDRQLVHVLTVEPRASFRTIAEVTGISDQTAARRYHKLSESAGLRVLGVVSGALLGWVDWFVRLQTTPGSADSIAEALARRPDTRWVNLASGGTEIICTVQASTPEQRDALFLRGLPGSRRVVQISAHSILHNFTPGAWQGIRQALSDEQLAVLSPGGTTPPGTPRSRGGCPPPRTPPGCYLRTNLCWPNWAGTDGPATRRSPAPCTGMNPRSGAGSRSFAAAGCCISRWTWTPASWA